MNFGASVSELGYRSSLSIYLLIDLSDLICLATHQSLFISFLLHLSIDLSIYLVDLSKGSLGYLSYMSFSSKVWGGPRSWNVLKSSSFLVLGEGDSVFGETYMPLRNVIHVSFDHLYSFVHFTPHGSRVQQTTPYAVKTIAAFSVFGQGRSQGES